MTERDYDLICVGSPTWWLCNRRPGPVFPAVRHREPVLKGKPFAVAVCCRRYWRHNLKMVRRLGKERGGVFADGIHFRYQRRPGALAADAAELEPEAVLR